MTKWITIWTAVFFLTGCSRVIIPQPADHPTPAKKPAPASPPPASIPTPSTPAATPLQPAAEKPVKKTPRAIAALTLTEQGRILIQRKKPDAAIRALERAMSLYPKNGEIYYYLAEAWLQKGNTGQAAEFNQLAHIHLQKDPKWASRVKVQQIKIKGQ